MELLMALVSSSFCKICLLQVTLLIGLGLDSYFNMFGLEYWELCLNRLYKNLPKMLFILIPHKYWWRIFAEFWLSFRKPLQFIFNLQIALAVFQSQLLVVETWCLNWAQDANSLIFRKPEFMQLPYGVLSNAVKAGFLAAKKVANELGVRKEKCERIHINVFRNLGI